MKVKNNYALVLDNLGRRRQLGEESEGWVWRQRPSPTSQSTELGSSVPSFSGFTAIRHLLRFVCCDPPSPHSLPSSEHGIS